MPAQKSTSTASSLCDAAADKPVTSAYATLCDPLLPSLRLLPHVMRQLVGCAAVCIARTVCCCCIASPVNKLLPTRR